MSPCFRWPRPPPLWCYVNWKHFDGTSLRRGTCSHCAMQPSIRSDAFQLDATVADEKSRGSCARRRRFPSCPIIITFIDTAAAEEENKIETHAPQLTEFPHVGQPSVAEIGIDTCEHQQFIQRKNAIDQAKQATGTRTDEPGRIVTVWPKCLISTERVPLCCSPVGRHEMMPRRKPTHRNRNGIN